FEVPPTKEQLYGEGRGALDKAWDASEQAPTLPTTLDWEDFRRVAASPNKALRYGLVGQLALKIVMPAIGVTQLKGLPEAPTGFSARSFARNPLSEFDAAHDGIIGGAANEPYASLPLRGTALPAPAETDDAEGWEAVLRVLEQVQQSPA